MCLHKYVYLQLCISVGTTEGTFHLIVICDMCMHVMSMIWKLCFNGHCMRVMVALVYSWTDFFFFSFPVLLKAALIYNEGPVYVSVWFNQVVLEDCIILSYVSELCSIMLLHPALLWSFCIRVVLTSCVGQRNLFLKTIKQK